MKTRMPRLAAAAIAVMALAVLSGCSSSGSSVPGTWGEDATGKPSLTIESDGTFSGTDGCNELSGKGTIDGDTFTFGPFASTQKACEGVHPWLNIANTAK